MLVKVFTLKLLLGLYMIIPFGAQSTGIEHMTFLLFFKQVVILILLVSKFVEMQIQWTVAKFMDCVEVIDKAEDGWVENPSNPKQVEEFRNDIEREGWVNVKVFWVAL